MKRINVLLVAGLVLSLSCTSGLHWKLKIEMIGDVLIDLNKFDHLVITNFLIKKETTDVDLNREIADYFNVELGHKFKGKIIKKTLAIEDEEAFENDGFWKGLIEDPSKTLFLTGSAHYTEEIRKAILEARRDRYEDPFPSSKKLAERKFYTLNLDLYLIDAQSGEALYKGSFKETKGYHNPNQTAYFAFFDLIQQVKVKLFRNIIGDKKIEERYIISK